jgi:hypothetical protein
MRPSFTDPFEKWLVIISFILFVIFNTMGFLIDERIFVGHFLAELAGIWFGILVAMLIVDRFKDQQWAKVRNLTYGAIAAHICDLAIYTYDYFPMLWDVEMMMRDNGRRSILERVIDGRDHPNSDTIDAMGELADLLEEPSILEWVDEENPMADRKTIADIATDYYEGIEWEIDQIIDVLTPRVINSSNDQKIINAITELDKSGRNLHNAIRMHKRKPTHYVLPYVIALLQNAQKLYSALYEKWI